MKSFQTPISAVSGEPKEGSWRRRRGRGRDRDRYGGIEQTGEATLAGCSLRKYHLTRRDVGDGLSKQL